MPFINLRDTPIRLPAGQLRIGRGRDVEITLPAAPAHAHNAADNDRRASNDRAPNGNGGGNREGQFALLVVDPSGSATLSKLSNDAPVYLNSVPAGLEPTPLLHGDRMEIDGVELRFSDDRATGATAEFPVWTANQGGAPMPIAGLPAPAGGHGRRA